MDQTFGTSGVAQTTFGILQAETLSLLVQPDGKIIAAGNLGNTSIMNSGASAFAVVRYNADGTIVKTFGSAGTDIFQGDEHPSLLWQDNELLIGSANTIRRLTSTGGVDPIFTSGLPGGSAFAVQSDGKILVNFEKVDPNGINPTTETLYRFTSSGKIDTTFGNKGKISAPPNAPVDQMLAEANGEIILVQPVIDSVSIESYTLSGFHSNGSVDKTFGSNGSASEPALQGFNTSPEKPTLLQQPNGQMLFSINGQSSIYASAYAAVTRFSAGGQVNTTFGSNGTATVGSFIVLGYRGGGPLSVQSDIALDSAGRLLLAGGIGPNNDQGFRPNLFAIDTNNDTGSITGRMFFDTNGNGKADPGESPLNWTCYIDVDNDGTYDNADIVITTNKQGQFTAGNLAPVSTTSAKARSPIGRKPRPRSTRSR